MGGDLPDGTKRVIVSVTIVGGEPTIPTPAGESAAGDAGNYAGTATTYQTVASWTVSAGKVGELKEIIIVSSDYAHTLAQVSIGGTNWCTDWSPVSPMPIIFEDLRLAATTVVTVSVKSSDGTSIDVDAIIVGKEVS